MHALIKAFSSSFASFRQVLFKRVIAIFKVIRIHETLMSLRGNKAGSKAESSHARTVKLRKSFVWELNLKKLLKLPVEAFCHRAYSKHCDVFKLQFLQADKHDVFILRGSASVTHRSSPHWAAHPTRVVSHERKASHLCHLNGKLCVWLNQ